MYSGGRCTERLKCFPQILPFLLRTLYLASQYHSHQAIDLPLLLLVLSLSQINSHMNVLNWRKKKLVDFAKLLQHLHDSFYIFIENNSLLILLIFSTQLSEETIFTVQSQPYYDLITTQFCSLCAFLTVTVSSNKVLILP